MANTHILIPILKDKENKNGWDYTYNEILERISNLEIDCPECENIIHSDDQYQCGTCGGGARINVLEWIKEQGKQISLDEKDIAINAEKAEEKMNKELPNWTPYHLKSYYLGYKQALKDIQ